MHWYGIKINQEFIQTYVEELRAPLIALPKEVYHLLHQLRAPGNFSVHKPVTRSESRQHNKVVSEPTMSDPRVDQIESETANKRDVEEMFAGLSAQIQQLSAKFDDNTTSTSRNSKTKGM